MAMGREDAEIVAGFLRDEAPAVATVDDWICRAARSFRRRLAHEWDDLLQDLRLEVFQLLKDHRFRGDSSLKSYLWQVVGHSCLDRIRAARRWRWSDLEEAATAGVEPTASADHLAAWSPARDLLMRVLERMPQGCRQLWEMIVIGLSYREMSARAGASEGALRVRVLRCRQRATRVRAELLAGCNESPPPDA